MKRAFLILTFVAVTVSHGAVSFVPSAPGSYPGLGVFPGTPVTIASETFNAASTFLLPSPGASNTNRKLAVIPQLTTPAYTIEFNIGATLRSNPQPGAVFVATGGTFAQGIVASIGDGAGCPAGGNTTTLVLASASQFRWNVTLGAACTNFPTITIQLNGAPANPADFVDIQDGRGAGNNLQSGVPLRAEVFFLDQATLQTFPTDTGPTQFNWVVAAQGTSATVVSGTSPTTATIDVATQKKNFLAINGDTITTDNGATVTTAFNNTFFDWPAPRGCHFDPGTSGICGSGTIGFFTFTMTPTGRDFTGFAAGSPTVDLFSTVGTLVSRSYSYSNAFSSFPTSGIPEPITSTIDGVTVQSTGSFQLTVTYSNGACGGGSCAGTLKDTLLTNATYTTWGLNGTILYAPFTNGNTGSFATRFYVCAPLSSVTAPSFDIMVTTVPVNGANSVTTGPLTVVSQLNPTGCVNIKIDTILAAAGLPNPYVTDGGNLAVQFTIPAPNAFGTSEVANLGTLNSVETQPMIRLNRTFHFPSGLIDPGP